MNFTGYTLSHRSKWNHPVLKSLLESSVWGWMIDSACWKDTQINHMGKIIDLERGQFITSIRFIAEGFEVGEKKVRNLLKNLESGRMVELKRINSGTIITICNYNKYQLDLESGELPDSSKRANGGLFGGRMVDTNKNKYNKYNKRNIDIGGQKELFGKHDFDKDFKIFWKLYPKDRAGKQEYAKKAYLKVLKEKRATTEEIKNGVEKYRGSDEVTRGYAKGCAAWLNDDRWKSSYKKPATAKNNKHRKQKTGYLDKVKNAGEKALEQLQSEELSVVSDNQGAIPNWEND